MKKAIRRRILVSVILAVVMLALTVIASIYVTGQAEEICWNTLDDEARSVDHSVAEVIKNFAGALNNYGGSLTTGPNLRDQRVVESVQNMKLGKINSETRLYLPDGGIVYSDGVMETADMNGEDSYICDGNTYASYEELLQRILGSETIYYLSTVHSDTIHTEKTVLEMSVVLRKQGEPVGILTTVLDVNDLAGNIMVNAYRGKASTSLVDARDCIVSVDTAHKIQGSLHNMTQKPLRDYTWERFTEDAAKRRESVMMFRDNSDDTVQFIRMIPSELMDFSTMVTVSEDVAFEMVGKMQFVFTCAISVEMIALLLYLLWMIRDTRKQIREEQIKFEQREQELEQQVEMQKALDREKVHLQKVHDIIHSGIWSVDFDEQYQITGVQWSDEFRHMLGFDSEEDFPNTLAAWQERVHPNDISWVMKAFSDVVTEAAPDEPRSDIEFRIRTKEGKYHWYHSICRMTRIDETRGELFGTLVDTTTEHENREHTKLIAALSDDYTGLYTYDMETEESNVVYVSDVIRADTGASIRKYSELKKVLQIFIGQSVHRDDQEMMRKWVNPDYVREQMAHTKRYRFVFRRKFGNSYKYSEMIVAKSEPVDEEPRELIIGFALVDDQYRQEMEQKEALHNALDMAESANRAKTTFLNNMSHDIRTPMNAIIGYADLAASHIDDTKQVQDYLGKIRRSSDHLLDLINDVLDMSRIESGKLIVEEQEENLKEIVRSVADIMQADAAAKRQELTVKYRNLKHVSVYCDRLRMNQALLNVLSNAVKYTQNEGQIVLEVTETESERPDCAHYEIRITDNGIGISDEFLKTIYDPFTRVRSSTVSGIQGTGLGMAITKNIVDMMGGTIRIHSKENEGTAVTLAFDFRVLNAEELSRRSEVTKNERKMLDTIELTGRRILVVEDNELNREIAADILSDNGVIVDTAEDGTVAVEKMTEAKPGDYDLILMDIQMPAMNGYEATRRIRALENREVASIPILAMTANVFDENRTEAEKVGMDDYISKPVRIDDLKKILVKYL